MKWKLAIAVVVAVGIAVVLVRRMNPMTTSLRTRELATRGLADYLAQKFRGHCAVVVSNPFTKQKGLRKEIYAQEEAGLKGLREGFGGKVTEVLAFPDLKSEARQNPFGVSLPEGATTPLSYLVEEGAFDKIASEGRCDLIVSLIGLPADLHALRIWDAADKHVFALLLPDLRLVGDLETVRKAVQSGKIAAFVLNKPGAPPEQAPFTGDWKAEFERRFVLVTADNFEEITRRFPQSFLTQ